MLCSGKIAVFVLIFDIIGLRTMLAYSRMVRVTVLSWKLVIVWLALFGEYKSFENVVCLFIPDGGFFV